MGQRTLDGNASKILRLIYRVEDGILVALLTGLWVIEWVLGEKWQVGPISPFPEVFPSACSRRCFSPPGMPCRHPSEPGVPRCRH